MLIMMMFRPYVVFRIASKAQRNNAAYTPKGPVCSSQHSKACTWTQFWYTYVPLSTVLIRLRTPKTNPDISPCPYTHGLIRMSGQTGMEHVHQVLHVQIVLFLWLLNSHK